MSGTDYLENDKFKSEEEKARDKSGKNPFYQYGGTWKATIGETKGEIARRGGEGE